MSKKKLSGFTIVELLIVIVVIAILAAISVVAYNGIQNRARSAVVHSDLTNAKKKLIIYNIDNGRYPVSGPELLAAGITISAASNYDMRPDYSNFYYCLDKSNNEFAIGARVASSGTASFYISSTEDVTPKVGLISQGITCSSLGLTGTGEAQGAFSTSGLGSTGSLSAWLKAGS